jgi:hypothetical protein
LHRKVEFMRRLHEEAQLAVPHQQALPPIKTSNWHWLLRPVIVIPAFASALVLLGITFGLTVKNARLRTENSQVRNSRGEKGVSQGRRGTILAPEQVFTLTLFPSLTKSIAGDQIRSVPSNSGLQEIRIHFELPGLADDSSLALEVMLVEPYGRRPVLNRSDLRSIVTTSGHALILVARPEELPPGDYVAFVKRRIHGVDDVLESYSFSVLRQ